MDSEWRLGAFKWGLAIEAGYGGQVLGQPDWGAFVHRYSANFITFWGINPSDMTYFIRFINHYPPGQTLPNLAFWVGPD